MNFLAVACDYDGTLAHDGVVRDSTIAALEKVRGSGRKLLLVTGRQLEELLGIFPRPALFEQIVAENGAVLYCPRTRESRLLTEPVPQGLPETLRARGVDNIGLGRSVVATWRPHECVVLEALRDMGLDRQIIFNKNAVMVLPTGVNKASGLAVALGEMKLSHHNVVAVGDAENDLPMLMECECGVAVANALESVKRKADIVTRGDHGAGVEELIAELLKDDLAGKLAPLRRRGLLLGTTRAEPKRTVLLPSLGESVIVAGTSGSGKSTAITGVLERMVEAGYQFCLFDPEGDYEGFEPAVNLGNPHYVPRAEEVLALLERMHSAVVNLLGVAIDDRPAYVSEVLRKLEDLRVAKGRPHWLVLDETHHLFPAEVAAESSLLPAPPKTSLMITVHPQHVRKETLATVDVVMAVGKEPHETIREFCRALGIDAPKMEAVKLERWEFLVWFRNGAEGPFVVQVAPGKTEHKRHIRKYADGDLGVGSFVFRGPEGKLNLVANNLHTFIRMAEGVDEGTWNHHLRAGHVSEWFRWIVKNKELADEVRDVESEDRPAEETKRRVIEAIQSRYTLSE
ncbi:HAD hydrolase family protein [Edaphobacter aggregans]|uniref:HAD hydrolase family protein n=1 Tax=Edaphobacter aggregans TaxID=570835 RepID=UPI0005529AF2|nr:HAD hydrolase family protein [Edaphobacter aggregans]